MSADDLSWAAETLVETERRRCVSRVSSVDAEDAVAKGDHYGSDMHRLKMTIVLHSGEVQQRCLFYKAMPTSHNQRAMHKKYGTFAREGRVYAEVLSELESIILSKEFNGECLWPKFYGAKRGCEGLLFEDLSSKGYKMTNRLKGVDYEHSLLVVRSLAKFHALAAILSERGDLFTQDYPFLMKKDPELVDSYYQTAFNDLATIISNHWSPEWLDYVEKLKGLGEVIKKELTEFPNPGGSEFYTLNHGDFWTNNMLFRYGRDGKPAAVRFIDFQLCNYNTPAYDLHYFLQTSPNLEARRRTTELLHEYHSSLEENLETFGYDGNIPTFQDLTESLRKMGAYGVGIGVMALPLVMAPRGKAVDMEDFTGPDGGKGEFKSFYSVYSEDETFISILQHILKNARENGYL